MAIINEIEVGVADIVFFTSAFTAQNNIYVNECNKPSRSYNHKACSDAFDRATGYAKMAITTCEDLGLDPTKVCREQYNFLHSYRAAA